MPTVHRSSWPRRVLISLVAVLVTGLVLFGVLPPVAHWQIETHLEALGARSVDIANVYVNPASGEVTFTGFRAIGPDGGELVIDEGSFEVGLFALTRRHVEISALSASGGDITLRRLPAGLWSLAGLPMEFGGKKGDARAEDRRPWQVEITGLRIGDSRLTVEMGETIRVAEVESLEIDRLSTLRPDEPTSVALNGRTADGSVSVTGTVYPFAERQRIAADIKIGNLDIGAFEDLMTIGRLRDVAGTLNVDGRLEAGENTDGGFGISYKGSVDGSGIEVRSRLFRTRSFTLSWAGDVDVLFAAGSRDILPGATIRGKATAKSFEFENLQSRELLTAGTALFDLSGKGVEFRPNIDDNGTFQIIGFLESSHEYARFVQPDAGLEVAPQLIVWSGSADVRLPPDTTALSASLSGDIRVERFTGTMTAAGIDGLNAELLTLVYREARLGFDGEGGMTAEGSAQIGARGFDIATPRNGFSVRLDALQSTGARGALERSRDGTLAMSLDGPLSATGIVAEGTDRAWQTEQESFAWNGKVEVGGKADGAARWSADGSLENTGVRLTIESAAFDVSVDRSSWTGAARGSTDADSLVVTGDNRVSGVDASLALPEAMSFQLAEAAILGIDIRDGTLGLGEASIRGFDGGPADGNSSLPVAKLGSLSVKDISLVPGGRATIGTLRGTGGVVRVVRGEDGRIVLPGNQTGDQPAGDGAGRQAASAGTSGNGDRAIAGSLRVGSAVLSESSIAFTDRSVSPVLELRTSRLEASLENFDTAAPGQMAKVALSAELDNVGQIHVDGALSPDLDDLGTDLAIDFRNMELHPFNPYIETAIGRGIRQGRANGKVDLSIADGNIDAVTQITISRLRLQRIGRGQPASSGPPVETAIDLLQDDEGVIRLSIPVSGSLADPQFDLSDAIGQAVSRVFRNTLMTAVNIAFPLGAVIAIMTDSGTPEVRIEPLVFAPATAELTPELNARLAEIAQFIRKTADVSPSLCGIATREDIALLGTNEPGTATADATALAQKRSDAVRRALIEEHGIAPDRLYACTPGIDRRDGAVPRVSVRL
ncbi:MAG: DUF748 domain-containing protein [Rhodospirillaceae bacterium]